MSSEGNIPLYIQFYLVHVIPQSESIGICVLPTFNQVIHQPALCTPLPAFSCPLPHPPIPAHHPPPCPLLWIPHFHHPACPSLLNKRLIRPGIQFQVGSKNDKLCLLFHQIPFCRTENGWVQIILWRWHITDVLVVKQKRRILSGERIVPSISVSL